MAAMCIYHEPPWQQRATTAATQIRCSIGWRSARPATSSLAVRSVLSWLSHISPVLIDSEHLIRRCVLSFCDSLC